MELNDLLGKNILTNGKEEFISLIDYLEKEYGIGVGHDGKQKNFVIKNRYWNSHSVFVIHNKSKVLFGRKKMKE